MIRTPFNADWAAGPKLPLFAAIAGSPELRPVTLPHDAIRDLPRDGGDPDGSHTGYFPGGFFEYTKTFDVPGEWRDRTVIVEFEGAYRDAMVYLNGDFLAQRPNGYSAFRVRLDPFLIFGAANTLSVQTRAHRDSRWYTGAGLHRDTHLIVGDPVHLAVDGVRITTPDVDGDRAVVVATTTIDNDTTRVRTVRATVRILDPSGTAVATGTAPVTVRPGEPATVPIRVYVPDPALWSADSPALYTAVTTLTDGDHELDSDVSTFGIRTLRLDPRHGLRINGETVKLRGACIHHDNGPLGAAAIGRADERRVEILKAAGFNAIRSAHNPISRATLDACDRLGMLVMDETFDMWTQGKSAFDYSLAFPEWWERDVEAMVAKDFNHPSVILYSIGNEIPDLGHPLGNVWGRRMADRIRELDPTRYLTNGINGLVSALDLLGPMIAAGRDGDTDVNTMMTSMGDVMLQLSASEMVSAGTEEAAAVLDVTGFNYGDSRYELDRELFPNRILVGSETFPAHIGELWRLVTEHPHVIGDFTWTGWDYLGEAGIGRVVRPGTDPGGTALGAGYPWLTANCGDIDITGHRRTVSYYRETVFGLRHTPYLAVHRPQHHGAATANSPWAWTDSVGSWSWDVPAGSPVTVDVYSTADEIELLIDGTSVGRSRVDAFQARFETAYQPGTLVAVAYTGGAEQSRSTLHTARGEVTVTAAADRPAIRADDTDLAYVPIVLSDSDGTVATHRQTPVTVTVSGPGTLAGLGTGRPDTEEPFGGHTCTTFDGRALAIVRPTGPGEITVHVETAGFGTATTTVTAHDHRR
ncbi:MAG TPA: glycoside hydrolase family 2 TIM barrel-domain containing protein [Actinoplanes sp.]|nr:glycoside hydrolase family 2 TIM barrel-domain containing protein [Actinoplanes sp.]